MPATSEGAPAKNAKRKTRIVIISLSALLVLTVAAAYLFMPSGKVEVICYLYDPCGGCRPSHPCKICEAEEFYRAKYTQLLIDAGLDEMVEFSLRNTLYEMYNEMYLEQIDQHGIPTNVMPVMFISDTALLGDDEITSNMADTIKSLRFTDRFAALISRPQRGGEAVFAQRDAALYFKSESCEDCAVALSFLTGSLPGGISDKILIYEITEDNNYELLRQYGERYRANPELLIPCVFVNGLCLVGSEEIMRYFEDIADAESVFATEMIVNEQ